MDLVVVLELLVVVGAIIMGVRMGGIGLGLWGVAEGSLGWAWVVWPIGLALLIIGAVAQGVAWGMDIYKERHP